MYKIFDLVFPDDELVFARILKLEALLHVVEADTGCFGFRVLFIAAMDAVVDIQVHNAIAAAEADFDPRFFLETDTVLERIFDKRYQQHGCDFSCTILIVVPKVNFDIGL